MKLIVHSSYFMDVESLIYMFQSQDVILDLNDSYVKQTYRSRCYIAAANKRLTLNIPIVHDSDKDSKMYRDIRIDHSQNWAINHIKSIKSAYKNSPFFEYYEDDFLKLYQEIPEKLQQWNLKTMDWLLEHCLIAIDYSHSDHFMDDPLAGYLINAKKRSINMLPTYHQVFQENHGFTAPISALDLLFNQGPASRVYLKEAPQFEF